MNSRVNARSLPSISHVCAAAAIFAAAGSAADGQVRSRGSDDKSNGGVVAPAPRPAAGLGGVRSGGGVRSEAPPPLKGINPPKLRLPGPIPGIGGVRSQAPRPISIGGRRSEGPSSQPPLPGPRHDPNFQPMRVDPWGTPAPQLDDRFRTPTPAGGRIPAFVLPDQRVIRVDGSGLTVDGRFEGDRLRLGVHLGSHPEFIAIPVNPGYGYGRFARPYYYGQARWWNGDGAYSSYSSNAYIPGSYVGVDPRLLQQPAPIEAPSEPAPANEKEWGDLQLRSGEAQNAVRSYKSWLKANPGDAAAMRSLGLAQIEEARTKEGVAMLALAYKTDPALASNPPPLETYRGGAKEWRDNLRRVSVYANTTNSASAWLAVAVFMQAEGRSEQARAMIDRASSAGLEPAAVAAMRAALMD